MAATALIQPLAWALPYAAGVALKKKKIKKPKYQPIICRPCLDADCNKPVGKKKKKHLFFKQSGKTELRLQVKQKF